VAKFWGLKIVMEMLIKDKNKLKLIRQKMTIIKKVGPDYDGDRAKGVEYSERAENNISELKEAMSKLEETLKKSTGYDRYNPPVGIDKKEISLPNCPVTFYVRSEYKTTKRPPYKEAVANMERYLEGIIFHLLRGRTITGIAKKGDIFYIGVEKLKEDFDIIVAGILQGGLEQTINYKVEGPLKDEEPFKELEIPKNPGSKTKENFIFYVRADRVKKDEENYLKLYKADYIKDLKRKKRMEEQVSSTRKVVANKKIAKGPDWGTIVKTIVTVPVKDAPTGELDELLILYNDGGLTKVQKKFPWYDLIERNVRNKYLLYVSICSVGERIQCLKEGVPRIKWKRYDIKSKPV